MGLLLLRAVAEHIVKAILAVVILVFSTYCLASRTPWELKDDRLAWLFGFAFLYAIVALWMGVRAFWRDTGEGVHVAPGGWWEAMRDAASAIRIER